VTTRDISAIDVDTGVQLHDVYTGVQFHVVDTGVQFHVVDTGVQFHVVDTGVQFHVVYTGVQFHVVDTGVQFHVGCNAADCVEGEILRSLSWISANANPNRSSDWTPICFLFTIFTCVDQFHICLKNTRTRTSICRSVSKCTWRCRN